MNPKIGVPLAILKSAAGVLGTTTNFVKNNWKTIALSGAGLYAYSKYDQY